MANESLEKKIKDLVESAQLYSKGLITLVNPLLTTGDDLSVAAYPPASKIRWVNVPKTSIEDVEPLGWTVVQNVALPIVVLRFQKDLSSMRALVQDALSSASYDLLHMTLRIDNAFGQKVFVTEFKIAPESLPEKWFPNCELENNAKSAETGLVEYYKDKDVVFLLRFRTVNGDKFKGVVRTELGKNELGNRPLLFYIGPRFYIYHGDGKAYEDWEHE